jgi:hypothetical protein
MAWVALYEFAEKPPEMRRFPISRADHSLFGLDFADSAAQNA